MDRLDDIANIAYQLSDKIDASLSKERELNSEIALLLENMSQQAYTIAQDLKNITDRLGI